ncbi:hypothetical protein AMK13_33110 [Streptomyces sp. CB02056]|nr:hypothetical protein AMK13_33110 [Streptomyces sp. CB02056]
MQGGFEQRLRAAQQRGSHLASPYATLGLPAPCPPGFLMAADGRRAGRGSKIVSDGRLSPCGGRWSRSEVRGEREMANAVGRLADIMGEPRCEPFRVYWEGAVEGLGTELPSDYGAFVERYGRAHFRGESSLW